MTATSAVDARTVTAKKLLSAVEAALADEAAFKGAKFAGILCLSRRRPHSVICTMYGGTHIAWSTFQYLYFARAIPEAFGYTTAYTDRGNVIVTTDVGEFICDFQLPMFGESYA